MNPNLILWTVSFLVVLSAILSALVIRSESLTETLRKWVDQRVDKTGGNSDAAEDP